MSPSFQYSFVGHDHQLITKLANSLPHLSQHVELAEALQAFKEEMPHLVLLDMNACNVLRRGAAIISAAM